MVGIPFLLLVSQSNRILRFIGLTVSSALTLNQLFIVIAPSLFGLVVNLLNSYQHALYLAGISVALGAIKFIQSKNKKRTDHGITTKFDQINTKNLDK